MLGRTANNVYWMARYVERAENMARLLATTYNMSLMPASTGAKPTDHWDAPLTMCGNGDTCREYYGDTSAASVLAYTMLDPRNPSSIRTCIQQARENARATRTALTSEVWEAINSTHLEMEAISYQKLVDRGYEEVFDWVKERSHLFRGAIVGTMRRGDAFTFSRLGTFMERSDNTARFLGIKWEMLAGTGGRALSAEDFYRWGALLRSFSALKAYREVYSVIIEPRRVAELLILRRDMPRSLAACLHEIVEILTTLRAEAGCTRHAAQTLSLLEMSRVDGMLRSGLPRYLNDFIRRNNELNEMIGREFMLVQ